MWLLLGFLECNSLFLKLIQIQVRIGRQLGRRLLNRIQLQKVISSDPVVRILWLGAKLWLLRSMALILAIEKVCDRGELIRLLLGLGMVHDLPLRLVVGLTPMLLHEVIVHAILNPLLELIAPRSGLPRKVAAR
jgi:hypothetical protein